MKILLDMNLLANWVKRLDGSGPDCPEHVPIPNQGQAGHREFRMKLVMFCHPAFLASQSMPRFARMLQSAYQGRGYDVELWSPNPRIHRLFSDSRFAKWAGYIDQYLLFPAWVRRTLATTSPDTLFIFCDQALGPWVPLVKDYPHVVHVHDLLALRSALGDLKENPTSLTGRIYQRYIRRGFRQARHFISVSKKTRDDLHRFGQVSPVTSEYVYNGLNYPYSRLGTDDAERILKSKGLPCPRESMLLHVGGGQWYKNLPGVLAIYARYAAGEAAPIPLWCIGPKPHAAAQRALAKVPSKGRVIFLANLDNVTLQAAYSYAHLLLFPSLAEGFGWPIVEALACGCPVITTDAPPMNEFASEGVSYLPRLQLGDDLDDWAVPGAEVVREIVARPVTDPVQRAAIAQSWAERFDPNKSIDAYLAIYKKVFEQTSK